MTIGGGPVGGSRNGARCVARGRPPWRHGLALVVALAAFHEPARAQWEPAGVVVVAHVSESTTQVAFWDFMAAGVGATLLYQTPSAGAFGVEAGLVRFAVADRFHLSAVMRQALGGRGVRPFARVGAGFEWVGRDGTPHPRLDLGVGASFALGRRVGLEAEYTAARVMTKVVDVFYSSLTGGVSLRF